jgi:hypothetical protein
MRLRWLTALIAAGIIALAGGAGTADAAPPAGVKMRVEGANRTIFEAPIVTNGHTITTPSGGTHRCDGTNNGANPTPGPTPTAGLDDAAALGGFTYDGTYSSTFDDYFITRIAEDSQTSTKFWGILVNYQFIPVGGCQFRIHSGDKVLFAYDAFNKQHFLKLRGPHTAREGRPITVTVTDGQNGQPIAGAAVGPVNNMTSGGTTDANGQATVTFERRGVKRLKAERSDSIRSNSLYVRVTR